VLWPSRNAGDEVYGRSSKPLAACEDVGKGSHVRSLGQLHDHHPRPRHVWLVRELPKGPTGKILNGEVQPPQNLPQ
jgi:hypothetical protein